MKKLLLFSLVICFVASITAAQERTSMVLEAFSSKSIYLSKATLWEYDEITGQWDKRNNNNVLNPEEFVSIYPELKDKFTNFSPVYPNFTSMRMCCATIEGKKYYVLYIKYFVGVWKKSAGVFLSWDNFGTISWRAYSEEDFRSLSNIKEGETLCLYPICKSNDQSMQNIDRYANDEVGDNAIIKEIRKGLNMPVDSSDKFVVLRAKGVPAVRFQLPFFPDYNSMYNFEHNYFEITYGAFKRLVELRLVD